MPIHTILYLGNLQDLDVTESGPGETDTEFASLLETQIFATFNDTGIFSSDLALVDVDVQDNDGINSATPDGTIIENVTVDADGNVLDGDTADRIVYDVGGGQVSAALDSIFAVDATVLLGNGSVIFVNNMVVFQTTAGDLFLYESEGTSSNLDGLTIQAIRIDTIAADAFVGVSASTFSSIEGANVVCFCKGTVIATPQGEARIEDLAAGDAVLTKDHGPQRILWIGQTLHSGLNLRLDPRRLPVRIEKDAFGRGMPCRDLLVSRQHRLMVESKNAAGEIEEYLIPAKDLLEVPGVEVAQNVTGVTYYHLLLQNHEVLWAEGMPSESLYLGQQSRA